VSDYVDIHAHVLPGIDDGPSNMEGTLALARAAVHAGTTTIVATPHVRSDFPDVRVDELADRCQEVRAALTRAEIPLRLVSGAEVSLSWALAADDEALRLASYGQRGTDLLIETPVSSAVGIDGLLYDLRARGYRITLAHPERNSSFAEHESLLRTLADKGTLLQINAEMLLGPAGRSGPRRFARHLLSQGLVHVIASDGHRAARWRPVTDLGEAVKPATELTGSERTHWMLTAVPNAIIRGEPIPASPPVLAARRRWRFFARD
jgi:protein-tyrosine phosphatase